MPSPRRRSWLRSSVLAGALGVLVLAALGCSAKRVAVGAVADALGGTGGGSFARDDDPELVRDALPFGLKLQETLLETTPDHRGLLRRDGQRLRVLRVSAAGRSESPRSDRSRRRARTATACEPSLPARPRLRTARSRSGAPGVSRRSGERSAGGARAHRSRRRAAALLGRCRAGRRARRPTREMPS